ncbi:MAG: aminotransferase class I/II-fold pyridoxal phosphate-dependent enzyme, partial [Burkholderiaceae bacterium]
MNPLLSRLQPYPFERLRQLFSGITPDPAHRPISLGIGEPRHPTPPFIIDALCDAARNGALASYPATAGEPRLREAFAGWLARRYGLKIDPQTRTLYVNSMDVGMVFRQEKRPDGSLVPYRNRGVGTNSSRFWDPNLYPCQAPPWGHLTAIDLDKGEFKWRVTLGEYDELTRRGVAPTGTPNLGGSLVTAGGLLFIAASNDGRFRAFDK